MALFMLDDTEFWQMPGTGNNLIFVVRIKQEYTFILWEIYIYTSIYRYLYLSIYTDIYTQMFISSVQFSHSVVSNSLQPHGLQHARPPCPPPIPGVHSNLCPLSLWCHPTISSSVVPFSSHLQSFPASGSFLMSQFFASGGQSIGVSVLPVNIQDWFLLGWTKWIIILNKGDSPWGMSFPLLFPNIDGNDHSSVYRGKSALALKMKEQCRVSTSPRGSPAVHCLWGQAEGPLHTVSWESGNVAETVFTSSQVERLLQWVCAQGPFHSETVTRI